MTFPVIEVSDVRIKLGGKCIHAGLDLTVQPGEILAIVGGSGAGKTTLLRELLGLQRPDSGSIRLFSQELTTANPATLLAIRRRFGVLFQQNALFTSLSVAENIAFPLHEHTSLDPATILELALLKLSLVGLPLDTANQYPAELSGGMQKRVALARALALEPELIFLDEPTAGLDPHSAEALDELILNLQAMMGLTIVMITHDMDSLWRVTHRVAFLGEGRVLYIDRLAKLIKQPHPAIQAFFQGVRGRANAILYQPQQGER